MAHLSITRVVLLLFSVIGTQERIIAVLPQEEIRRLEARIEEYIANQSDSALQISALGACEIASKNEGYSVIDLALRSNTVVSSYAIGIVRHLPLAPRRSILLSALVNAPWPAPGAFESDDRQKKEMYEADKQEFFFAQLEEAFGPSAHLENPYGPRLSLEQRRELAGKLSKESGTPLPAFADIGGKVPSTSPQPDREVGGSSERRPPPNLTPSEKPAGGTVDIHASAGSASKHRWAWWAVGAIVAGVAIVLVSRSATFRR